MSLNHFTQLIVWQSGHKLVLQTYQLTSKLPPTEQFGLTNQMRRAVISITSNIAEGFSRQGIKEKIQFFFMARGSLTELENQLIACKDLKFIDELSYNTVIEQLITTRKLLDGLIRKFKSTDFRLPTTDF